MKQFALTALRAVLVQIPAFAAVTLYIDMTRANRLIYDYCADHIEQIFEKMVGGNEDGRAHEIGHGPGLYKETHGTADEAAEGAEFHEHVLVQDAAFE